MEMESRRIALRAYFLEVVRDLVARGMIRRQAGQSLSDVLRSESRQVLAEVERDLVAVAADIGVKLAGGLESMLRKNADALIGAGVRAIVDRIGRR